MVRDRTGFWGRKAEPHQLGRLRFMLVRARRPPSSAPTTAAGYVLCWKDDDYDVREGAADGPVVGRIYKLSVAPTGKWWFWAVQLFPAVGADSGTAETREAAMDAFKAQWIARRGWEHPWIVRS